MRHNITQLRPWPAIFIVIFAVFGGFYIINSFGATSTGCTSEISPGANVVATYATLTAGQTLCLHGGSYTGYEIRPNNSGTSSAPITLMSYPGERATLTVNDIYIPGGLSYHTFKNLNIQPSTTSNQAVTIQVSSNYSVWQGNDINGTNKKTCMIFSNYNGAVPRNTLVKDNKFHDCGDPAHGNQDHAIYLERSVDATITENVFWNTAAFAIHLYSDADNTTITHNVIDASGYGAVIFASDQNASTKTSDNNTFAYNMVTNSPRYGMTTYWGPAGVGVGNSAHDNCSWGNATNTDGLPGVTTTNNVNATTDAYTSSSTRNYTLKSGSNCLAVVQYDAAAAVNSFFAPATTTTFSNWAWDAKNATVTADSSSPKIQKWLRYAIANPGGGTPNVPTGSFAVATAEATESDPVHVINVTSGGADYDFATKQMKDLCSGGCGGKTISVRMPNGTKMDPSSDGHLTVRNIQAGTETDFWQAKIDTATGEIYSTSAVVRYPINSVNEIWTGWSGNAASTPLRRGLITPEDIKAGAINQTLQFAHRSIGGTASTKIFPGIHNANTCDRWYDPAKTTSTTADDYPALNLGYASYQDYLNDCNANYLPEGTWMRLDPTIDVTALGLPAWQVTVAKALQNYGMILRDNGGTFSVYGENTLNRGGTSAWTGAGLGSSTSTGFSSSFPWNKMQVLSPPSNITSPPPTCTSSKPSDINCDNNVNIADLSILLSNYGKTTSQLSTSTPSYPRADINNSGKVDIADLSVLLSGYGR